MSDICWAPVLTVLQSAIQSAANAGAPDFAGYQLGDQIRVAGNTYDASYNCAVAAASAVTTGSYPQWLSQWTAFFGAAGKAVVFAGGAPVPFSATDPGPISAALATAIAVMQGAPSRYGPDAVLDSQRLLAQVQELAGAMPSAPTGGPAAVVTGDHAVAAQLRLLITRANEYIAFLAGHP